MQDKDRIDNLYGIFAAQFGSPPTAIFRAPGRVELLGGHTDYNDGFVLPAAIDRDVMVAVCSVPGDRVSVYSSNYAQETTFELSNIQKDGQATWSNYVRGVIDQLQKAKVAVPGMAMAIEGNVPLGSGLSSSAAIEVAVALAVQEMAGSQIPREEIAILCQRAENQFLGVNSGIMDQFISLLGGDGKAMFLDCRTLEYRLVNFPAGVKIVVSDSKKPRTLAGTEYNIRRAQCEEAVRILSQWLPGIGALRDVSVEEFEQYSSHLPEIIRKRAGHVVHENQRVLQSADALSSGDAHLFGVLMNQSHASARDLYEISIPELNWLQEAAVSAPGCLGSRLSGAGFGGCTVSVVHSEETRQFRDVVVSEYVKKTGFQPDVDVLNVSGGAGRVR